ncbi:MAG TPA: hypothetical protein G4O03_00830 [Dehalococcoidia bacterium]|nr:hypothetical protein [Dehalococcoidia bacterium]
MTFKVRVPANTPPDEKIYLIRLKFIRLAAGAPPIYGRWPMSKIGDNLWTVTVPFEKGHIVRYRYVRERCALEGWAFPDQREARPDGQRVIYRALLIPDWDMAVEDVVARWGDKDAVPLPLGVIRGRVVDATSGKGVEGVVVSAAGWTAVTAYNGSYEIYDVPCGKQTVTVFVTPSNRYKYSSQVIEVIEDSVATADFTLEPAKQVRVVFRAAVPPTTPESAQVRLIGSIHGLGSQWGFVQYPLLEGIAEGHYFRAPPMEKVDDDTWEYSLTIGEGTHIEYFYTIGDDCMFGVEKDPDKQETDWLRHNRFRSLIVPGQDWTQSDTVVAWSEEGQVAVTLNVKVPVNTPATDHIAWRTNWGPTVIPMTRVSPYKWTLTIFADPGIEPRYVYERLEGAGERCHEEFTPDIVGPTPEIGRTLSVPESDLVINDMVSKWRWFPDAPEESPPAGSPVQVGFWVTLPYNTPADDVIYLAGEAPELGSMEDPKAVAMTRVNEVTWSANVTLKAGEAIRYRYTRGSWERSELALRTLEVKYANQTTYDAVVRWADLPLPMPPRVENWTFMGGARVPDAWLPDHLLWTGSTMDAAKKDGLGWIKINAVYDFERIDPLPLGRSRGFLTYPSEDLELQIKEIRRKGLKIYLAPQAINYPQQLLTDEEKAQKSREWWEALMREYEKMTLYYADIAEETGVEMLGLYRVVSPGDLTTVVDRSWVNQKMDEVIWQVRQRYHGLVAYSGYYIGGEFGFAEETWDFFHNVDVLENQWGGPLSETDDPSISQMEETGANLVDTYLKPIYLEYGKPIVNAVGYISADGGSQGWAKYQGEPPGIMPSYPYDEEVPLDLQEQADVYEGLLRVIAERPWMIGVFAHTYLYLDALTKEENVRGKPTAKVMEKWYRLLKPLPGDVNRNGYVDIFDLVEVAAAFNTVPGDPDWNGNADLNSDGMIDIFDLVTVGIHYGQETSNPSGAALRIM